MKKLCLLAIFLLSVSICDLKAQADSVNIWVITNQFLVENGEKEHDSNPYPGKEGEWFFYPFFIFTGNGEISDPNFVMPYSGKLNVYSFGILAPHKPMHLLFFKKSKWYGINMKKTLPEIMNQCINLCAEIELTNDECIFVFKDALRRYQINAKNHGGVPIDD